MDEASQNVVAFLNCVLDVRDKCSGVWNHYTRRGLKVSNYPTFGPIWYPGGFSFGIMVTGADGRNYELSSTLRWAEGAWVVQADVSLEQETERGDWVYPTLREMPERRTSDWPTALGFWRTAVVGLTQFDDLIPT